MPPKIGGYSSTNRCALDAFFHYSSTKSNEKVTSLFFGELTTHNEESSLCVVSSPKNKLVSCGD